MRTLLLVILLFILASPCYCQDWVDSLLNRDSTTCPDGQTWHWGMASTSMVIESGCYADSDWTRAMRDFAKSLCGDGSFSMWEIQDGGLSYDDISTWDDSLGCTHKERWGQWRGTEWVEITKAQYDSVKNSRQQEKP